MAKYLTMVEYLHDRYLPGHDFRPAGVWVYRAGEQVIYVALPGCEAETNQYLEYLAYARQRGFTEASIWRYYSDENTGNLYTHERGKPQEIQAASAVEAAGLVLAIL